MFVKNNEKKITLNIHMFVFICIAFLTILNDNISYFTNLKYEISLLISIILVVILNIFLFKNFFEVRSNFNILDLLAIIPYTIIYFIIMLDIDDFVDAISYHLYNFKNPFIDRINFDLLPSSSFFFPLGDRMNYIFVNILGYRFGRILSLYSSIIIFYQIKNFMQLIIPKIAEKTKVLIATIILYTFSLNLCIGEYSIDIFSTTILLELLYIACINKNYGNLNAKKCLYLATFLAGLATGIKISNIVFAILILCYMIIELLKNQKKIKIYDIFALTILFFGPFVIYMINAYIQTKNPIFPFYNFIFKSDYYEMVSSKDTRLGAKNLIEMILWPIVITVNPLRGDDIRYIVDPVWAVGYIVSICYLIKSRKMTLIVLNVLTTIAWIIFVCGYVRYGMFIAISYFLIEIYLLNKIIVELKERYNKSGTIKIILKLILIIIIITQITLSVALGIVYMCIKVNNSFYVFNYKNNVQKILIDDKVYNRKRFYF